MIEEEIRNVVEMRNRELTFEKDDIVVLLSILSYLEDAIEKTARCKTLGHMLAEVACDTSPSEGFLLGDNVYNMSNMIFDCSNEANDIVTRACNSLRDLTRKIQNIK